MLLRSGYVHVIASDAHSADYRPPILSAGKDRAAAILENEAKADALVEDNPRLILQGCNIEDLAINDRPSPPGTIRKARWTAVGV
jgi:protein-tyrosine phosphatase